MTYEITLKKLGYSIESGKQTPMFTYHRWVYKRRAGEWSTANIDHIWDNALEDFMSRVPLDVIIGKKRESF